MRVFIKDPEAVKEYSWNWAPWLDSDTIKPNGVTFEQFGGLIVDNFLESNGLVIAWISGGTDKTETGMIRCKVETVLGRIDVRSARFKVQKQ